MHSAGAAVAASKRQRAFCRCLHATLASGRRDGSETGLETAYAHSTQPVTAVAPPALAGPSARLRACLPPSAAPPFAHRPGDAWCSRIPPVFWVLSGRGALRTHPACRHRPPDTDGPKILQAAIRRPVGEPSLVRKAIDGTLAIAAASGNGTGGSAEIGQPKNWRKVPLEPAGDLRDSRVIPRALWCL